MKIRADRLLAEAGLCESRAAAQRLIMAGQVRIGADRVIRKSSEMVDAEAPIHVVQPYPYVSRGAEKLLGGVRHFAPPLEGTVCLDIGASTGGFTDVLLQHGATRVYAVDVGHGQLHQKLREDPRVVCLERVNARRLTPEQIPEPVDILVGDVSFISLRTVLPPCRPLLKPGGWVLVLVKPQFEARREEVGRGGVVRDPVVRDRCVATIETFCRDELGWDPIGHVPSPITGPKGNQEFIVACRTPQ